MSETNEILQGAVASKEKMSGSETFFGQSAEILADLGDKVESLAEKTGKVGIKDTVASELVTRVVGLTDKSDKRRVREVFTQIPALLASPEKRAQLIVAAKDAGHDFAQLVTDTLSDRGISLSTLFEDPLGVLQKSMGINKKQAILFTSIVLADVILKNRQRRSKEINSGVDNISSLLIFSAIAGITRSSGDGNDGSKWSTGSDVPEGSPVPFAHQVELPSEKAKKKKLTPRNIGIGVAILFAGCSLWFVEEFIKTGGKNLPDLEQIASDLEEIRSKAEEEAVQPTAISQPTTLPRDLEIKSDFWESYKNGIDLNPITNIDTDLAIELTAYVGPTWMWVPQRESDLQEWFGEDFTPTQINDIFSEWKKTGDAPTLFNLLNKQKNKPGLSEDQQQKYEQAIEFYRLRVDSASPQEFIDKANEYIKKLKEPTPTVTPQQSESSKGTPLSGNALLALVLGGLTYYSAPKDENGAIKTSKWTRRELIGTIFMAKAVKDLIKSLLDDSPEN